MKPTLTIQITKHAGVGSSYYKYLLVFTGRIGEVKSAILSGRAAKLLIAAGIPHGS